MKLRDVIDVCNGNKLLIKINCEWEVTGDKLNIKPRADLSLDADVTIAYYWYDHLHPDFRNDKVDAIFETRDWDAFVGIFQKAQEQERRDGFCYMPHEAWLCIDGECIGEVSIKHKPFFEMLTFAEHECG